MCVVQPWFRRFTCAVEPASQRFHPCFSQVPWRHGQGVFGEGSAGLPAGTGYGTASGTRRLRAACWLWATPSQVGERTHTPEELLDVFHDTGVFGGSPLSRSGSFFLRHGGPPPKALHQSGLTMGKMSVHGEPKFCEGQPRVFTKLVRVKTLHELHLGPEKVKILVEAISVKDAKGYIAYTKAKWRITKK